MENQNLLIKCFSIWLLFLMLSLTFVLNNAEAADDTPYEPAVWKGNVTAGGNFQTGNTDRFNAAIGADALRKSDKERYSLNFLFNYSEEDGRNTAESYYRIYGYIGLELLKDKFKDLSLQTVLGPGAGYQLWDEEKRSLSVEGGISYFSDNYIVAEDNDYITARLAGDVMYKLLTSLTFTDHLIIYPSLEDFGNFQLRNEATVATPLASGWALKFINILEYNSDPPADIKNTDLNWILSMQYSF